jgi:hypothetical protein
MATRTDTPIPTRQALLARKRRAEVKRSAIALTALFAEWAKEDDAMTPEELEQARRDTEAFQERMNASRVEVGEEPVY